jgi:CDP-glycerol glycerophosphotransferase (TagB/SpsB family)
MTNVVLYGAFDKTEKFYNDLKNNYNIIGITDEDNSLLNFNSNFLKIYLKDLFKIPNIKIIIITSYVGKAIELLFENKIKTYYIAEYSLKKFGDFEKILIIKKIDFSGYTELKKDYYKISFINTNYSGSNSYALYKNIPHYLKEKYIIKLLDKNNTDENYYYDLITSNLTIGTQGPLDHMLGKNSLELWHGFAFKGLSLMDPSRKNYSHLNIKGWQDINYLFSYSQLYSTFMNSRFALNIKKYVITGMPRNDYLFNSKKNDLFEKIFDVSIKNKKLLLFAPTFRDSIRREEEKGNKNWSNFWGFDHYCNEELDSFLEKNNYMLIIKLHPFEEKMRSVQVKEFQTKNILFLTDSKLYEAKIDFYEFLNLFDMLITDYSSIYFDFLLLDKPILFNNVDFQYYNENQRGFMIQPYDIWTAGPKIQNQENLQKEIINLIKDKNYFFKERQFIKKICHKYEDGNSSKRIWDFIDEFLSSLLNTEENNEKI